LLALGAFLRTVRTFIRWRPQVVIGFGSYVAGPVVLAALCLGIPTIVHEQNAVPGLANRFLAPFVTRVLVSTPETRSLLRKTDAPVVGIPLRRELLDASQESQELGLEPGRKTLLIFGGSQGARRLCRVASATLPLLKNDLTDWQTLFITGPGNYDEMKSQALPSNVILKDYVDAMGAAYAAAALVVARAGAVSLAEITAMGLPAILIPLPIATGGHQVQNARVLERRGAARVIEEAELTPESLAETIRLLLRESSTLDAMASASKTLGKPNATEAFLKEIDSVCKLC